MSTTLEEQTQTQAPVEAPESAAPPTGAAQPTPGAAQPTPGAPQAGTVQPAMVEEPVRVLRPALAATAVCIGTAFLVGGMFTGVTPRILAALGAIGGVLLAVFGSRSTWRPTISQILSLLGIFVLGILALMLVDTGAVSSLGRTVGDAIKSAKLRRPPVSFEAGWRPVLVWTLSSIAYASAWIGIEGRKPARAILLPMPVIAFAAIAQPPEEQVAGGIVALVGFIIALAVIFRPDEGGKKMSAGFEVRRAARSVPLVLILVAALVVLGQTNILFPAPLYDPTQKAVLPKAVPLSDVKDRVLFIVRSPLTGPWRTGVLDVYDGSAWRLPPFSASSLKPVEASGILDPTVRAGATAHFEIAGLEGHVLPMPTRAQGIVAQGPALVKDDRTGTVRLQVGQLRKNLIYDVAYGVLPTEGELNAAAPPPPEIAAEYLDAPPVPAAVKRVIDTTPGTGWKRLDTIRRAFLDKVIVKGSGLPVPVPPDRVADMLAGSHEGSPFEIVAAQALVARWAGVPSRIGYGFDKGESKGANLFEIRPRHGSLWLEVYLSGYGWLPVTGQPRHAKKSLNPDQVQQKTNQIPTEDIQVQLFLPLKVTPPNLTIRRIQIFIVLGLPVVLLGLAAWTLWPLLVKARRRSRRRQWALQAGPSARIAVTYAEFRDVATDLGVGDPHATPLAFLDHVVPDEEHTELAWLITRSLWGDLSHRLTPEDVFAAEELSRALRRRIVEAQPITIRLVSFISRLSLKEPYAPNLPPVPVGRSARRTKEVSHAAAVSP